MKKLISLTLVLGISCSVTTGYAEYVEPSDTEYDVSENIQVNLFEADGLFGRYPSEDAYTLTKALGKYDDATTVPGSSPAENVFYITDDNGNETSYVLLDKDDEGNYFVISETEFGQYGFTSTSKADVNKYDTPDSAWEFDPENRSSVAYWLNNKFLKDGNGAYKLPESIKENLLEKEWVIENNVTNNRARGLSDEEQAKVDSYIESRSGVRKVTAKLALPSYTEYVAYQDKISAVSERTYDAKLGFLTRTITSKTGREKPADEYIATFEGNFLYICGSNNNQQYVTCNIDGDLTLEYFIRPVFWLDNDFFKDVKIDLEKSGENVLEEVRNLMYADLTEVYTDEELQILDIDTEILPSAEVMNLSGLKMQGALTEINYTFNGFEGKEEGESLYEIYVSDNEEAFELYDTWTKMQPLPEELSGKYIKVAVIPFDIDNFGGARAWSRVYKVSDEKDMVVTDVSVNEADGKISAAVNVTNNLQEEADCQITIARYDEYNQLKAVVVSSEKAVNGENVFNVEFDNADAEEGDCLKVMVRADGKPVYYKSIR